MTFRVLIFPPLAVITMNSLQEITFLLHFFFKHFCQRTRLHKRFLFALLLSLTKNPPLERLLTGHSQQHGVGVAVTLRVGRQAGVQAGVLLGDGGDGQGAVVRLPPSAPSGDHAALAVEGKEERGLEV